MSDKVKTQKVNVLDKYLVLIKYDMCLICRGSERYESRGWRGRDTSAGRRDAYGREYDRGRRDRYSPPRREFSPPQKRMRRDWYVLIMVLNSNNMLHGILINVLLSAWYGF